MFPNLGKGNRLGVGVEFTDFQLGYQIVDDKAIDLIEYVNPDAESTVQNSFDERFSNVMETSLVALKNYLPETVNVKVIINDKEEVITYYPIRQILSKINKVIEETHIAWSTNNKTVIWEDNKEDISDLTKEIMSSVVFKAIGTSTRLAQKREELRAFWGDATDIRFDWVVHFYGQKMSTLKDPKAQVPNIAKSLVNLLANRRGVQRLSKEETSAIWSTIALLCNYDYKFPVVTALRELDKATWRAFAEYIWWNFVAKMKEETLNDGAEPLDISAQDDESGPHYTIDYCDILANTYESTGEKEFKQCFNTYHWLDEAGQDHLEIYKSVTNKEYNNSLSVAVKVGDWLLNLYNKGHNLHNFRLAGEETRGFTILRYIEHLSGQTYSLKEVEILVDGEVVKSNCKVMAPRQIIDYHESQLKKLFWSLYNIQVENGIIVRPVKEQVALPS